MWEFVDKIVFINLEKRKDRLEKITEVCKRFPTEKVVRFNAIETPGFGILGCGKSHAAVLKMAIENGWNNVLILEDDVVWNNFEEGYKKLEEIIKNNYDVIMLGGVLGDGGDYNTETKRVINVQTAGSYIVHSKFYHTLLQNYIDGGSKLEATGKHWIYANDQYWKCLQTSYNFYMVVPNLMYQAPCYSNCGDGSIPVDYTNLFMLA